MTEEKTLPYWRNMRSAMEWLVWSGSIRYRLTQRHQRLALQQPRQTGMRVGRCIQGRHKCLPTLRIKLEVLPVGQSFGHAGLSPFQHEVSHTALGGGSGWLLVQMPSGSRQKSWIACPAARPG